MKRILSIILLFTALGLGLWLGYWFFGRKAKEQTVSSAHILLEKVEKVCKLVTVEGNFDEWYDESNIRQFSMYFPLPGNFYFTKKASLRVKGKVLVGYDMANIRIKADSLNKTITLSNLPSPEILSIDHDIEYRDLAESWFNTFTTADYTNLNKNAKEALREKAMESRLMDEAQLEGNQMIEVIRFMTEAAGWKLVLEQNAENVWLN